MHDKPGQPENLDYTGETGLRSPSSRLERIMATITVKDLPASMALDRRAMSAIQGGGGAPWVFGWIQPYVDAGPSQFPVINFYQINNFADQMINQYQTVSVSNTGANATLNVAVDESSLNKAFRPA
jgi:hypothetical protein